MAGVMLSLRYLLLRLPFIRHKSRSRLKKRPARKPHNSEHLSDQSSSSSQVTPTAHNRPERIHSRKDSKVPSLSSGILASRDSSMADATSITNVKCSEYFHEKDAATSTTRPCMGKNHAKPHYVCAACIEKSRRWRAKITRATASNISYRIFMGNFPKPLCRKCSATAAKRTPSARSKCRCTTPETSWYCFECADVISWSARVQHLDIVEIVKRHGEGAMKLCPGCEGWYKMTDITQHYSVCMACKDVYRDAHVDDDKITEPPTMNEPYPPLQSPTWMGHIPPIRRQGISYDNIAPDAIPPSALQIVEKAINTTAAMPTTRGPFPVPEWEFPRSSGVKIGPPKEGASAVSDALARHILRSHFADGRCWVGTHGKDLIHESDDCAELSSNREIKELARTLWMTEEADNKELGIEVELGRWM